MRPLLSLLLLAAAAQAQEAGWINIQPDAKLTNWTRIHIPPTDPLGEKNQWHVAPDGDLICDGDGGHEMLRYDKPLSDFLLHVEWKFSKKDDPNARYNSGVFVRNDERGVIWHQAQAGGTNGGYLFGNSPAKGSAPARFNLSKTITENRIKPAGEWNVYDIRCEGKKIEITTNGKVTNTWEECEVPTGYIALEAEGYRIEFRNVRVKPLK